VLHFGIQAANLPPPSIMPLSKVTCLDMDRYWQARAHASSINTAEAEKFKQTAVAAILELINELFELAEIARQEHVSDALRRLRFLSYSAIYPIAQQLQQLVTARKTMSGGMAEGELGAPFWEQFLADCRAHLLRCEKLSADSAEIRRQCIQMMSN
jgi:tRNA U34 5-methylaminomethyl-2-thiouridine-forming methyltransferase MnmC